MFTGILIGRVTADIELQTSENGNKYVCFNVAVNKGYGENAHTLFPQCFAFGEEAEHIIRKKVRKGSLVYIIGDQDLVEFQKRDMTMDKNNKIIVHYLDYLSIGKPKEDGQSDAPVPPAPPEVEEIDGDKIDLP